MHESFNRGYLKEGYFADLTIFDEEELKNIEPDQSKSFGIKRVFINGKQALVDDKLDEQTLKTSEGQFQYKKYYSEKFSST